MAVLIMDKKLILENLFDEICANSDTRYATNTENRINTIVVYHKKWYYFFSKLIYLFTGEKSDHIANIYTASSDIIKISEQTALSGGKFDDYTKSQFVERLNKSDISLTYLYIAINQYDSLTLSIPFDKAEAIKDAEKEVGEVYGFGALVYANRFYQWIDKKFDLREFKLKKYICSTHAIKNFQAGNKNYFETDLKYMSPNQAVDFLVKKGFTKRRIF